MEHESIRLTASGFDLHTDVWEGGDAESVLLLHGLGGNSITWHGVAPRLALGLRARVLAPNLPGFGASRPAGKRVGFEELVRVVTDLLERQAPRGTAWRIAGNSLGGTLALAVAVCRPELVARITLASVALPLTWGRAARDLLALGAYVPTATPWLGRRLVARYMRATGLPGVVDEPIRWLFGDPARLDPELRRRLLEVSGDRLTWADEASRVLEQTTRTLGVVLLRSDRAARWIRQAKCPVQSIHGDRDPLYPLGAWQKLQRVRPDWQHVLMPSVGHVPQLEAPEAFAGHLLAGA